MDESCAAQWFDPLFRTDAMRKLFSDRARLRNILAFEAALARAQGETGVIPAAAAKVISEACQAESFDIAALSLASAAAGNSAIPIVNELTRRVAAVDAAAANYVHWGATSQDAMDTGLVLQMRQGLDLIETHTLQLASSLIKLADEHKETPMVGRTWMQHGAPTSFGLKVAGWLDAIVRSVDRLRALRTRLLVLQFGGPVGSLAALGSDWEKVAECLANELKLTPAVIPWHAQRDRPAEAAATLGVLVGSLGKMARDISLMSQTEIAEVAEPAAPGRGGSSSMPQKRNPVGCAVVLSAAVRVPALVSVMLSAMPQEQERGLGGWHAEWETLPEIFLLTSGALTQMCHIGAGLHVDVERMRANLDMTRGLVYAESVSMALARSVGRTTAHQRVARACRRAEEEGRPLREVAGADVEITAHLSVAELDSLFDPREHVRSAARLVDQALAAARSSISPSSAEGMSCPS